VAHGEPASRAAIARSSGVAAMAERVDGADRVGQRRLRGVLTEVDAGQPGAVTFGPGAPVVEANAAAQQQLGQPVPAAHQVDPDRLARAHEVAQGLLFGARHADRVQLAGQQQPHEVLGVAAVGLDPLAGRARDLARRRHHALNAAALKFAREPVAGRAGLIGGAHRPRQTGAQRGRLTDVSRQAEPLQLARLGIEHRRHDLGGVHVQADERSSLRHGWLLLFDCGPPRGGSRAAQLPHDRRGGPAPSTAETGRNNRP
jgi:hypothetical protein